MKSILFIPMLAIISMMTVGSCSGGGSDAEAVDTMAVKERVEAVIDSGRADSIAFLLGSLLGNDRAHDFLELEADTTIGAVNKEDYLRGVKVVVNEDNHSASYTMGVQAAHELLLKFKDFKNYNVEINREMLLAAIEKQLRADSVSENDLASANTAYNELLQRIYNPDLQ